MCVMVFMARYLYIDRKIGNEDNGFSECKDFSALRTENRLEWWELEAVKENAYNCVILVRMETFVSFFFFIYISFPVFL